MAWFNLFKKKQPPEVEEKQIISFKDLKQNLKDKEEKQINNTKSLKNQVNKAILEFTEKLKSDIITLRQINLNKKRENEKLKSVVLENLNFYVQSLEKLIENLLFLKSEEKDYLANLNNVLNTFTKNSRNYFEKATILIGDELGHTQSTIKAFINNYQKMF